MFVAILQPVLLVKFNHVPREVIRMFISYNPNSMFTNMNTNESTAKLRFGLLSYKVENTFTHKRLSIGYLVSRNAFRCPNSFGYPMECSHQSCFVHMTSHSLLKVVMCSRSSITRETGRMWSGVSNRSRRPRMLETPC